MDQIFKDNPKVDVYYKTSDNTPFFSKNAASNHAKTLDQKNIETITRGSVVKDSEKEKNEQGEKLTPKQQLQAEYEKKFGEVPAEEFTKAELSEAIEKGEKLVAKPNNEQ